MRAREYEKRDPRIATTIKRCEELGLSVGYEESDSKVSLFIKNVYRTPEQTALLNHLNFN